MCRIAAAVFLVLATSFELYPFLRKLFADGDYPRKTFASHVCAVRYSSALRLNMADGFKILSRRWVVDRNIDLLNPCRRVATNLSIAVAPPWCRASCFNQADAAQIGPLSLGLANTLSGQREDGAGRRAGTGRIPECRPSGRSGPCDRPLKRWLADRQQIGLAYRQVANLWSPDPVPNGEAVHPFAGAKRLTRERCL